MAERRLFARSAPGSGGEGEGTMNLTNCLFQRVDVEAYTDYVNNPIMRNNLFWRGTFDFDATTFTNTIVKDNLFDQAYVPDNSAYYGTYSGGHNAYVTNAFITNEIPTYSSGGSVAVRTNSFGYDATAGIDLITATNALHVQVSSNAYNAYHELTTNFDGLNQFTILTYNTNQQLISAALPSGLISTNIYESDNWLATNFAFSTSGGTTFHIVMPDGSVVTLVH